MTNYKSERDSLIKDVERLRQQRDEYRNKLNYMVELLTLYTDYKLSLSHNKWYLGLRKKVDEVLKDER